MPETLNMTYHIEAAPCVLVPTVIAQRLGYGNVLHVVYGSLNVKNNVDRVELK